VFRQVHRAGESGFVDKLSGAAFVEVILDFLQRSERVVEELDNRARQETGKAFTDVPTDTAGRFGKTLAESAMLRDLRLVADCNDFSPKLIRKSPALKILCSFGHDAHDEAHPMPSRTSHVRTEHIRTPHVRT